MKGIGVGGICVISPQKKKKVQLKKGLCRYVLVFNQNKKPVSKKKKKKKKLKYNYKKD
jgi:hypothetical protein